MRAEVIHGDFVGIEREAEYVEIARRRIGNVAPLFASTPRSLHAGGGGE